MSIIKKLFERDVFMRVTLPILLVLALAVIALMSFQRPNNNQDLSEEAAKIKAESFINSYLMQSGTSASIMEISEEYGLYKLKIDIISDIVESYLSKDGRLFFPQALNIDEISGTEPNTGDNAAAPVSTVDIKSDQPTVELFVMSHCPYGTQIEKGILPVLNTLGDKIDFELKFVDYAMHGEKELREQLSQYCIQKNEPEKLLTYLSCFLEAGDDAACVTSTGLNKSQLDSCIAATDEEFKVMENFTNQVGYQGTFPGFDIYKADNLKYGVAGSPTLIINGQEVSSARDSASLLGVICSAFNEQPEECSTILPADSPAPGFGSGTVSSSASSAANACAPAQL